MAPNHYHALIQAELENESQRKRSLEQRGLAVVTASGTLVALLFGFMTGDRLEAVAQQPAVLVTLAIALAAFIVAGVFGIRTNYTVKVRRPAVHAIWKLTEPDAWSVSADIAERRVARVRVRAIESLRVGNAQKAKLLRYALILQAVATVGLAVGVVLMVL